MINVLKGALKSKSVISLCTGKIDWEKRFIGYVQAIDAKNIEIELIDFYGSITKKKKIRLSKISMVEINDSYNKHLERLKAKSKQIKKAKPNYFHNKGKRFILNLEILKSRENVNTIFFGTEYLTGIITTIEDDFIIVKGVGYLGTMEGELYCAIDNITRIRFDGPLETKLSFLTGKLTIS